VVGWRSFPRQTLVQISYLVGFQGGVLFPCEIVINLWGMDEGDYDLDSNHTDVGGRREAAAGD
jgi:hypothetical protein